MQLSLIPRQAGILLLGCLLLAGCGGGNDRLNFSGDATFDGNPIVYGSIIFIPDTAAGHKGPTGSARIIDGKYDTQAEGGQGVLPGKHLIKVSAYPSAPPEQSDETATTTPVKPLFLNWEIKADLTSDVYHIAVPPDAEGFKPKGVGNAARDPNEP